MGILWMYRNKGVSHLPARISETFPNLIYIGAGNASIVEISRENFRGLRFLRGIYLTRNQIEKVESDVFEDLESLKFLDLCEIAIEFQSFNQNELNNRISLIPAKNKIKFLNGKAVEKLANIREVLLNMNSCIDSTFKTPDEIELLPNLLDSRCGFEEKERMEMLNH
jgi:hypothetical protein